MKTTDKITPRPVWWRYLRRLYGIPLDPPTQEEIQDAIRVLDAIPSLENLDRTMAVVAGQFGTTNTPALSHCTHLLHVEAQKIMDECSE